MQADRWVRHSQYGREGRRRSGNSPALAEKIILRETATVWAVSRKSEFGRLVKEMIFLSAHQSSNPICPATQCGLGAVISGHGGAREDSSRPCVAWFCA